jgi:hypothetical protein
LILLKDTILLIKSQLVTSYTLKHDVNRCFLKFGMQFDVYNLT